MKTGKLDQEEIDQLVDNGPIIIEMDQEEIEQVVDNGPIKIEMDQEEIEQVVDNGPIKIEMDQEEIEQVVDNGPIKIEMDQEENEQVVNNGPIKIEMDQEEIEQVVDNGPIKIEMDQEENEQVVHNGLEPREMDQEENEQVIDDHYIPTEFNQEELDQLVDHGHVPDHWCSENKVTWGFIRKLIDTIENKRWKLTMKMKEVINLLVPSFNVDDLPPISNLKRKALNPRFQHEPVDWLIPEDPEYIGPMCQEAGLNKSMILNNISSCDQTITNGMILEIRKWVIRREFTLRNIHEWLEANNHFNNSPTSLSFMKINMQRIYDLRQNLSKNHCIERLTTMLDAPFFRGNVHVEKSWEEKCNEKQRQVERLQEKQSAIMLAHKGTRKEVTDLQKDICHRDIEIDTLKEHYRTLQTKYNSVRTDFEKQKLEILTLRRQVSEMKPKNLNRKIKRRDDRNKECLKQIELLMQEKATLIHDKGVLQQKVNKCQQENQEQRSTMEANDLKLLDAQTTNCFSQMTSQQTLNRYEAEKKRMSEANAQMRNTIQIQEKEIQELLRHIDSMIKDRYKMKVKDSKTYKASLRKVISQLSSYGVSARNVSPAIQSVVEGLFDIQVESLPHEGTVRKMISKSNEDPKRRKKKPQHSVLAPGPKAVVPESHRSDFSVLETDGSKVIDPKTNGSKVIDPETPGSRVNVIKTHLSNSDVPDTFGSNVKTCQTQASNHGSSVSNVSSHGPSVSNVSNHGPSVSNVSNHGPSVSNVISEEKCLLQTYNKETDDGVKCEMDTDSEDCSELVIDMSEPSPRKKMRLI